MIIDSPIISGSYAASGSLNQFGNVVISGSLTVTGSIIGTASFASTASYLSGYVSPFPYTGSAIISGSLEVTGSANIPNITGSLLGTSSFALTSSYSLSGGGFPYSGSAQITGSLVITNLSGSGVRYLVADSGGNITAQSASAALKSTQAFTSTAGQTTFSVTNGYSTGYVDVFINGSKLSAAEFTDTSGTDIVLATGSFSGDVVEVVKYIPAAGVTNNVLRQLTTFTATAGQTVFSASYTPGLIDIFYNGARLSTSDYTANNGTFFTLATASAANDVLDVLVYSYQVGAFSGIGGQGVTNQIAYFNTTSSITGSSFYISGSNIGIGTSTVWNPGGGSQISVDLYNPGTSSYSTYYARSGTVVGAVSAESANTQFVVGTTTNHPLAFYTNNVERMRINSTGSVGIGTTSLNWNYALLTPLQIRNASLYAYDTYELGIQTNAYYDSNWRYQSTNTNPVFQITLGNSNAIRFNYANAGSAGSIFTWNEAMRITSTGSIGIGTSTVVEGTQAASSISIFPNSSVSNGPLIQFAGNGRIRPASGGDRLSIDGNALFLNSFIGGNIVMATGGGNVGVGTSSPSVKFHVAGGSDYNTMFSSDSSRAGWVIATPGTTSAAASGLVLASDGSFRLGNATQYQIVMYTGNEVGIWGGGSERMRVTSGGNVYIGTTQTSNVNGTLVVARDQTYPGDVNPASLILCGVTNPSRRMTLGYDTTNQYGYIVAGDLGNFWTSLYLQRTSGAVYAGTARIDNNSDIRVKDNIQPITNALDKVLSITGKKFHMLDEPEDKIRMGFIAQELEGVVDELVIHSDRTQKLPSGEIIENVLGLETWGSSWAALLVEAVKEQQALITSLQTRIEQLENK